MFFRRLRAKSARRIPYKGKVFSKPRFEVLEDRSLLSSFQGLGITPGGVPFTPSAITSNGQIVVGNTGQIGSGLNPFLFEPFRWTSTDGLTSLSGLFPSARANVSDSSADGSVLVGRNHLGAFRWSASQGLEQFEYIPRVPANPEIFLLYTVALAVSADGRSTVGNIIEGRTVPGHEGLPFLDIGSDAFIWRTQAEASRIGSPEAFRFHASSSFASSSMAKDISADGGVVTGSIGQRAYRLTAAGEFEELPPDYGISEGAAVSANGNVIVGRMTFGGQRQAFRWTNGGGVSGLGLLPGTSETNALDTSRDGSVVVGTGIVVTGTNMGRAFIWDAADGMRDLREVLIAEHGLGSQLNQWTLTSATDITPDGRTIVGMGINPAGQTEGWILRLDGSLDIAATSLTFNSTQGGVDFKYEVTGANITQDTTAALYWSPTPDFDPNTATIVRASVIVIDQPNEKAVGEHGPFFVSNADLFQNQPNNLPGPIKYLLLVVDPTSSNKPRGMVDESRENNNVRPYELITQPFGPPYRAPDYSRPKGGDIDGNGTRDYFYGTVKEDDAGNRVEIWVIDPDGRQNQGTDSDPWDEYYSLVWNGQYEIGICPYEGGQNEGRITFWGDSDNSGKSDGIHSVGWRSTDDPPDEVFYDDDVGNEIWPPNFTALPGHDKIVFLYLVAENELRVGLFDESGNRQKFVSGPPAHPGGSWIFNGQHVPEPRYFGNPMSPGPIENSDPIITEVNVCCVTIGENGLVQVMGNFDDPDSVATHTITIDWDDGTTETINRRVGIRNFSAAHRYLDNEPASTIPNHYAITVRLTSDFGETDLQMVVLRVDNLLPTGSIAGADFGGRNQPFRITLNAMDPSPVDQTAGFTFRINWGDGSPTELANGPSGHQLNHVYVNQGTYTIEVTATDKDGGTSQVARHTVAITPSGQRFHIDQVLVNSGEAQRSNVERLTIRFNQATNNQELVNTSDIIAAVQVFGTSGIVLDASRFRHDAATFTLTIDLTVDGFGGSRATLLTNGKYQLRLNTSLIFSQGDPLNKLVDDDGTADGAYRFDFHRLLGDFDGDGRVRARDLDEFFAHFRSRAGQPRYDFAYDLNRDGVIGTRDLLAWIRYQMSSLRQSRRR